MTIVSAARGTSQPDGLSGRRFLTYVLATPTLAVAVRAVDDPRGAPVPEAMRAVPAIARLGDVPTLAALATSALLVVEITEAGRTVVHVWRAEVDQGITAAIATIATEDLGAAHTDVDVVLHDARPESVRNQVISRSDALPALCRPMRYAAAVARARLVDVAAAQWGVDPSLLATADSAVHGPDGLYLTFAELTVAASIAAPPLIPTTKAHATSR